MIEFRGIWNDNEIEHVISIYLDPHSDREYGSWISIDDSVNMAVDICRDIIIIEDVPYVFTIDEHVDELIICGRQIQTSCLALVWDWLCSRKPSFFVITNRTGV